MKVSGFTFIRNATVLGYPYIDSLKSLLMLCDEVVVAVGDSVDDTLEQIQKIDDPRLRIISTTWNEKMQDRGYVYAQQKMIAQFNCTGDWVFYLEGDEIIHEEDIPLIRNQMQKYLDKKNIEALVFDYYHFYGNSDHIAISPRWYRQAPRILRNTVRSWAPDGLFWVIMNENKKGRYPNAALVGCHLYHYGHVRSVIAMNEKNKKVEQFWGNTPSEFKGYGDVDPKSLTKFLGTHPKIVENWLTTSSEKKFILNKNHILTTREKRHRVMMFLGKFLGNPNWTKKHFTLIKD